MRKIQLLFILIFLIILGGCFENSKKADLVLNIKWNNERVEDILDSKRIIPKATEKLEIKIYKGYSVIKDNIVHSNSINSSTNSYVIEELDTGPHTIEVNAVDERGHYYAYAIKKIELKSGDNTSKIVLKLNIILEVNINNKYFSHEGAYIVAPNDNVSLTGKTYYL